MAKIKIGIHSCKISIKFFFLNQYLSIYVLMTKINFCVMKKYICNVCGWIYDPEIGDPDHGVPAGTSFDDVPDTWVCPVCEAEKSEFSLVS